VTTGLEEQLAGVLAGLDWQDSAACGRRPFWFFPPLGAAGTGAIAAARALCASCAVRRGECLDYLLALRIHEVQQVGIDDVGVDGKHAVRIARIHLQRAVLQ
jgi:Transcription factor WhiB